MKKTKKATKTKIKPAKKPSTAIPSVKKTSAESLDIKGRGRTTKFAPILEQARTLKIGDALELSLEKNDAKTLTNTRNWLANLIKKHVPAPKGGRVVARTTKSKSLAIVCEKAE
jgi:hypothetical protein